MERLETIIGNIPKGFLTKPELELLIHRLALHEDAIAFTDNERGTFSPDCFPDYVMRTVPHVPGRRSPFDCLKRGRMKS